MIRPQRVPPDLCLRAAVLLVSTLLFISSAGVARAQQPGVSDFDRDRWRAALDTLKHDIEKHYYDPTFHGKDLDAHFKAAEEKLKQAQSLGQVFGVIAQALLDFDDSHLFFIPPGRSARYDYGWRIQMVGDRCYVTDVKPGSDAEAKGLKPGDEIISLDGYRPARENLWKLAYLYYTLRPKPGVRFVVARPDGRQQQLNVLTKVTQEQKVIDLLGQYVNVFRREAEDNERERREGSRAVTVAENLLVWKLNAFNLTNLEVDGVMSKARKHKALIIDLRGNGGGLIDTLLQMLGGVFDRDVRVGDMKMRKEAKPFVAKTRGGDKVFKGPLVVLVDSQSGSSSEMFARVVQLEQRGVVLGDRSAGAVMVSRFREHQTGVDIFALYGASVTEADIIMTDGRSLEHTGVTPDKVLLPTAADLAAGRDPVLSQAAMLLGFTLDPEKAGALFPVKWKK